MQNEQLTQEAIRFCYRFTRESYELTEKNVMKLLEVEKNLREGAKKLISKDPKVRHGKMKIKHLIRKDEGATSVDIAKTELRDFQKVAKRYGVDFAVVKHKGSEPPVYSVFFKARDQDAIADVIRYYTEKKLMKEKRPSLHERIKQLKQKLAERPKKTRSKAKEKSR